MQDDIKNILRGISAIYKQLDEIKKRLDNPPEPIVIETQTMPKKYDSSFNGKYAIKSISDKQMGLLEKLLRYKPEGEKTEIFVQYQVDQLNQLTSKQASEVIKRYMPEKP